MTEDSPLDLEDLRSWIGSTLVARDVLTAETVARFRATFDQAPGEPRHGEPAPLLIHFCLAPIVVPTADLAQDGHLRRNGFLPEIPLPRRMWAGGAVRFDSDLRVGEMVERRSRVADIAVKQGRTGQLCFVTVEHDISVDGETRLRERQDIVFREAATATPAAVADPAPGKPAEFERVMEPSAALLFRYSAITFNAHRIHYDRPYARDVEAYPGLVVHGPLQATWLSAFASDIAGRPPKDFTFRAQSPLFDDAPVVLQANRDGERLSLWTARPGGPKAMIAEARW